MPDQADFIVWTDVLQEIPYPILAHNAEVGARRVEARLWKVPARENPHQLRFTLFQDGAVAEIWSRDYPPQSQPYAVRLYSNARHRAERFLEGWPLINVRPSWAFECKREEPGSTPGPEHR